MKNANNFFKSWYNIPENIQNEKYNLGDMNWHYFIESAVPLPLLDLNTQKNNDIISMDNTKFCMIICFESFSSIIKLGFQQK